MKAVYARQSVDRADSISVESQIELCTYELKGDKNFRVFCDRGYSGKNLLRPQFQQLLDEIRQGQIEQVIVYKLDRISRSVLDFANLMELFEKHRVEFISCSEKFDTSTPMGRAMLSVCIVFAQLERETIAQRVTDAFLSRSEKGYYMGGRVPYGYRLEKTVMNGIHTGKYIICEEEAMQIRLMYSMYSDPHCSYGDILNTFNSRGLFCRGKPWDRARIADHLKNPVYVRADGAVYDFFSELGAVLCSPRGDFAGTNGCYLYTYQGKGSKYTRLEGRRLVLAPHEGLVDSHTWLICKRKTMRNRQIRTADKVINTWLAGLVKCGRCGYALTFKKYKGKDARYLFCSHKMNARACAGAGTLYADEFEEIIKNALLRKIAAFRTLVIQDNKEADPRTEELRQQITGVEKEIESLMEKLPGAGEALTRHIDESITALERKKGEALYALAQRKRQKTDDAPAFPAQACCDNWNRLGMREKQRAAWALIERIEATNEYIRIFWKL